jgi:zinc transporter
MVTVVALPISLVVALLGMNVGGLPLADHPHGFSLVITVVVVFTLGAAWLALRRIVRRR